MMKNKEIKSWNGVSRSHGEMFTKRDTQYVNPQDNDSCPRARLRTRPVTRARAQNINHSRDANVAGRWFYGTYTLWDANLAGRVSHVTNLSSGETRDTFSAAFEATNFSHLLSILHAPLTVSERTLESIFASSISLAQPKPQFFFWFLYL